MKNLSKTAFHRVYKESTNSTTDSIQPFSEGVWEQSPRSSLYWSLFSVFEKCDMFSINKNVVECKRCVRTTAKCWQVRLALQT